MGAKSAEKELGAFDCVHTEHGKAPSVGKLTVFKTSLVFKAEMFGFDSTTVSIKRRDLDSVDATSMLTLKMTYKETKQLDLQFTKSKLPYRCLVDGWKLKESDEGGAMGQFALNEKLNTKSVTTKDHGEGLDKYVNMAKEYANESYEDFNNKFKKVLHEASRLGAKIPPTPRLPTIDCEEVVSRCLFVKIHKAENLLSMDSDGASDPFVTITYRGLEATSSTKSHTLSPEWDEVFHFRTPPGKEELDEEDTVELVIYDRDFALNDFIGYTKLDLSGLRVNDAKPRHKREWKKLEVMPKGRKTDFFDINHMKEKLMFWEGERPITGQIEIETWVGNRHDQEFRVAGVPTLKTVDVEADKKIAHYVDPVTALLRVEVKRGRNILPLDSDGASDPYCEVALVDPKGLHPEQSQATHYIDDATDPEWDRTFNFIVAKPYSDNLMLRVYDYDGATSFDDLIGQAIIGVHELAVHQGIKKAPEEKWLTLLDKEGKDRNAEGTVYGDILVRAYLDEEYFQHLHGGNATGEVGRLSVDVMQATELPSPVTTFAVVKMGPYWTRLPSIQNSDCPKWNQRLRYPVFEPAARVTIALFEGTATSCKFLGRVKLQLSTMEDGVRYAHDCQLMTLGTNGKVTKTCKLECGIQFDYHKSGALVAKKYMEPLLPDKWYFSPMQDEEKEKVIKAQKEMIVQRVGNASPPLDAVVAKELLEFAKHEVNIGSIKSSIARIQRLVAGFDKLSGALTYALSWDSIPVTAFAQMYIVYLVYYPNMFMPTVLLGIALYSLALFPSRYQRVLDRMEADEWLSIGLPFAPPTEEEERLRKEREEEEKKREEEEEKKKKADKEKADKANKEDSDKEAQKAKKEKEKEDARKKAEADAKPKLQEAFTWDSINPLAALQKQMDEVFTMITISQNILDEVAGAAERLAGILAWEEPRVTAGFVVVLLVLAWMLIYVEAVTRFFVTIILGVVVKTIFTIISPATIKFGISAGILFVLRHPAILPDEQTKVVQEAKKKAEREAEVAAEHAGDVVYGRQRPGRVLVRVMVVVLR